MILQTGGSALGWISTRSKASSSAMRNASSRDRTPIISPSDPITRTRGTRISWFFRFCLSGVLIFQSPGVGWAADRRWPARMVRLRQLLRTQGIDEVGQRHCAQIFSGTRTHRHRAVLLFAVTDHQQVRHALQRVLADLKADLFVPQIRLDAEALI